MNKKRREQLGEAEKYLNRANSLVESVCYGEQDAMDNIPDNLQESERYAAMEDAVDDLQEAQSRIGDAISYIQSASSKR